MEGFHAESCNKFVLKNLCWIIGIFLVAGLSVGGVAASNWLETDRIAREAETKTIGNTSAIDELTKEVRETNSLVRQIGEDVAVVKDRTEPARSASGPGSVALAETP